MTNPFWAVKKVPPKPDSCRARLAAHYKSKDYELLMDLWAWFDDVGAVEHVYAKATQDA